MYDLGFKNKTGYSGAGVDFGKWHIYVENLKESIRKKVTKAREILQSCRVQIKTVSKKKKDSIRSLPYTIYKN